MRASRVHAQGLLAGFSSAGRGACPLAALMTCLPACLLACLLACNAYDPNRLSPEPAPTTEPAPVMQTPTGAGTGGSAAAPVGGAHSEPFVPARPNIEAGLPLPDDDASAPSEQPLDRQDRKRLTIDEGFVDEDLHDFPLWVQLTGDSDLMRARADGRSLYFTDALGHVLDAELEVRDLAEGDLAAWVRVPLVSSTADTVIYLYWDDGLDHAGEQSAAGVWSAGFEAVFHLSDDRDSSAHAHHGEDFGSTAAQGQLGGARSFDGHSYIAVGQGMLPAAESYTITAWIRPDLTHCGDYCAVVTNNRTASPFQGITLYVAGDFVPEMVGSVGTWEEADPVTDSWHFSDAHVVSSGSWRFVAITMQIAQSGGGAQVSLDGEPWGALHQPSDGNTMGFQNATDSQLDIGRFEGGSGFFHEYAGEIDELRIASTARSASWIRAEHENQRSESSFVDVMTERR